MNNVFNPPAIISAAPVQPAINSSVGIQEISFKDKLYKQFYQGEILLRGINGRTYNYIDDNGEYISSFLSPYNPKILDNVEPGVKSVIEVLLNKGYLTWGSCQGHPEDDMFCRWIGLAFISEEERNKFVNSIDKIKLPIYWYNNFLNFVDNPKKKEVRDGITLSINLLDKKYKNISEQRLIGYDNDDLTEYWNLQFSRSYQSYYPIMMCICSIPGDTTLWNRIKNAVQWPFRNYYTNQLAKKMQTLDHYYW
jgi:hypothetical protein